MTSWEETDRLQTIRKLMPLILEAGRVKEVRDLYEAIVQIQLEIEVNSNPGTASSIKSEAYWTSKNMRWRWMLKRFKAELDSLTEGREQ